MKRRETICIFGAIIEALSINDRAWAQLIPDTTLGTENSIVAPDIPLTTRITGGATRGGNLFHSFQELSIGANQTAWFDNPASIQSILVRVTGNNRSDIDGTLRANGIADLFILNPNGISFGTNAKLNIGGAFSALTTVAIPLGEQGLFSAVSPAQSQLLTIKPSATFDLARFQPQKDITFKANWSPKGPAINFIAKNITLDKAQINNPTGTALYKPIDNISPIQVTLQASEGIAIKDSNIGLYGGLFQATAVGTIVLDNSRILSKSSLARPAAGIFIDGGRVELNRSGITMPTNDDLSLLNPITLHKPVILDIRSADSIAIDRSRINQPTQDPQLISVLEDKNIKNRSNLYPLAMTIDAKNIIIQNSAIALRGGSFEVKNMPDKFSLLNSQIFNYNYMSQASGPITIQAKEILNTKQKPVPGNTPVGPADSGVGISTAAIGRGDAGNITLNATNINIKGPKVGLGSNTLSDGNAGNITLTAIEDFRFESAGIGNSVKGGEGRNGELKITARDISVTGFSFNMDNSNLALGNKSRKGKISLNARRNISIGQGEITTTAAAEGIFITGGNVKLLGLGITVPADDSLLLPNQTHKPVVLAIRSAGPILINSSRINQPVKERSLKPATFDGERDKATNRTNLAPLQISLETPQDITIQNSAIAVRGGEFQAVIPGTFSLEGSQLYSDNFMAQAAAPITIQAQDIRLDGYKLRPGQNEQVGGDRGISSNSIIAGQAATINLTATNDLTIKGGQGIGSNTLTDANTGDIRLTAGNTYEMDSGGIGNQSRPNTAIDKTKQIRGNNGQIIITAKNIKLNKFGFNMDHFSQGGNGSISFIAAETIDIGEGGVGTNAKGSAIGANILVSAKEVIMRPRSALSTSGEKQSQGGNIKVEAKNQFTLQGSVSTGTNGEKSAGNIDVLASQITIEEGVFKKNTGRGNISSYTGTAEGKSGTVKGDSGTISLKTIGSNGEILLRSGGGIINTVFQSSTGNSGKIVIAKAGQLNVKGGSQIIATTNSIGQAGLIDIKEIQRIKLVGSNSNGTSPSGILSTIQTSAKGGSSEGIRVNTPLLDIANGAGIISSALGQGNSGTIDITADRAIFADKTIQGRSSGILTSVGLGQIPISGLFSDLLEVQVEPGAGRFSRTTLNPLVIAKTDNQNAKGNSGAINLNVGNLDVLKGAQLVTAIVGDGKAGNVTIQSKGNIRLLDRGAIRADSGSGQGGNIDITGQKVLLLRRGGEISAVSRGNGQDGNITVTTPFIVGIANENSDIFAISKEALNGGRSIGNNVKINAQGILGFEYRSQFTSQNDIVATGNVTLNLPDIDPSRGLTVLPTTPIDITQKIDKSCNPNNTQSSSFVTRGTGGLPASPTTPIVPNGFVRLAQVKSEKAKRASVETSATPVEAQISTRLADGRIRFQSKTQEKISQNYRSDCLNVTDPIPLNPP